MGGGSQGFDFGDIFSQFGGMGGGGRRQSSQDFDFDLGDILSGMGGSRNQQRQTRYEEDIPKKEVENLDVTETIEIPFLDFLFDTALDVKTVYNKHLPLKVKAGTKPGTKFKISGKGRTSNGKTSRQRLANIGRNYFAPWIRPGVGSTLPNPDIASV